MQRKLVELLEQGFNFQQLGEFEKAKECYFLVLNDDKKNQFALNLLGVISIEQQQYQQAVTYLEEALTINDTDPDTYNNLGLALTELKDLLKAKKNFESSLKLNSNQPSVLNNLGNIFASLNDHDNACKYFDAALHIDNRYLDCLNNLSLSLKALGQIDKALKVLEHAIKVDPQNSTSFNNQGEMLNKKGDYENAKCSFEKAISIDKNIVARINLSTALKQLGDSEQAKQQLEQVLIIEPENTEANNHLGVLYEQLGDFEQAAKYFRLALNYSPVHASSFYQLSKLKNQRLTTKEIETLKVSVENDDIIDFFKSSLWLSLACEYEKQKNFSQSMQCFIEGKKLKAKQTPYKVEATKEYQLACEKVFDHFDFSTSHLTSDTKYPIPIFIIGMPRSGTTLTEQILSSHSQILGAGELGFINDIAAHASMLTKKAYPFCVSMLSENQKIELRELYLNKVVNRFGYSDYVIDKNPLNYNFTGFIAAIFPDAKFVYCKRDAMDNCTSIFKLPFDDNQSYSHELSALGHYYCAHQKIMSYWQSILPRKILTIEYEKTVSDLEYQSIKLLKFIGVMYEDSVLNFHNNERIVMTPSAEQVRQPIYKTSINAWQRYGELLAPLQKALNYQIETQKK